MQTLAAIDIGSNSCRLKIARVVQHSLRVVHEDREVTRLGTSVFETGLVSPDAMAATLRALKRFYRAVQQHGADQTRAVATAAMRDARNGRAFLAWVRDETGWEVEIISGLEEARLIHRGVVNNEPGTSGRCLLIDVGGGSCEVSLSERKRLKETISLPLGAVRLTEEFLKSDPPAKEEIARMKQFVSRELRKASRRVTPGEVQTVIATSGTTAALFEATRIMRKARAKDYMASARDVRRLADKLTKLKNEDRSAIPGIGPRRSEIVVAGAQVYSELLEHFTLAGFRYSDMGLRDGVLAQMLAEPVRQHAAQLFNDMRTVHELPAEYQTWLEAAAMLRDIGKFMNYQGHHRHAQYIIANSEIFGFNATQRVITSAVARYIGKSRPEPEGRTMRQVLPEDYENVKRAVVLLRLAVALNQDRASDVLRVRVRTYPKRILLELSPGRTGAELELWSLRKEADYFREVFRRELFVTLA